MTYITNISDLDQRMIALDPDQYYVSNVLFENYNFRGLKHKLTDKLVSYIKE